MAQTKEAKAAYARQWRLNNPERAKEITRKANAKHLLKNPDRNKKYEPARVAWKKRNPDKMRNQHLRRTYGITLEDQNRMLAEQFNQCAICSVSFDTTKIHIDHDHNTNKVRGLLCAGCNTSLYMVEKYLEEASNYLFFGIK